MIIDEIGLGVLLIRPKNHNDNRGSFMELYNLKRFNENGINCNFIQDNISFSKSKNTLRGLHFQKSPYQQSKFISLISGSILDIFIDIRKESKNFGKCYKKELTKVGDSLFIPKGFLHGFCTLEDNTLVSYKVDEVYSLDHELGLNWYDPYFNIKLPFKDPPIISYKDSNLLNWTDFIRELD